MPGPPCACGCGELAKYGNRYVNGHNGRGVPRPESVKRAVSAAMSGEKNHRYGKKPPQFKGWTVTPAGYVQRWAPEHPHAAGSGYVMEHRLVMEAHLVATDPGSSHLSEVDGRWVLRRDLEVHHRDGDKQNNALSNLEVLTKEEHARRHMMGNTRRARR